MTTARFTHTSSMLFVGFSAILVISFGLLEVATSAELGWDW